MDPGELSLEISQFLAIPGKQIRKVTRCSVLGKGGRGLGDSFPYRKGRHCFKEISLKNLDEKQRLLRHNHEISDVKFVLESQLISPRLHRIVVL